MPLHKKKQDNPYISVHKQISPHIHDMRGGKLRLSEDGINSVLHPAYLKLF